MAELVRQHNLSVIAIGNGTAGRETEQLVADMLSDELKDLDVAYVTVNEAGAACTPPVRWAARSCPRTTRSSAAPFPLAAGCSIRSPNS